METQLKKIVQERHLGECVRFLGYVPDRDLPSYYQAADFFVLPTRELEGFGLVILESLACGTPVLGTPVGAIPEIIGPFCNDLLFNGTNSNDIREKMEDVIQNPEKYRFDPENCRRYVEERFSWKKMADAFEKEAQRLIANGPKINN